MTARTTALAVAVTALAACGAGAPTSSSSAQTPPRLAPADAQSQKVVAAANAFLASLTEAQRKAASFAYTDQAQRQRWTNFPVGMVPRAGVRWGELNADQRNKLTALLATVLSPTGMKMVSEQMAADDVLKANPGGGGGPPGGGRRGPGPGGPPGGGGGGGGGGSPNFGADYYYVAFLGTPRADGPWMLQFGGHHLAINATVAGPNITLSPSLTGGQPLKFSQDGKTVYIVEREVMQSRAMLNALSAAQRAKAVISPQRIDLVLGPGHDGQALQPEGLAAAEMSEAQKAQLLALIEARLDILNADDLAATMAPIRRDLNKTSFAWWGPTDPVGAAYFRVTAPTLILEFSPQDLGGDPTQHAHNMYRDPTNEYGAAWAPLK